MDEILKQMSELWISFQAAIASFVMAFLMALIRTYKTTGRADVLEAIMCALFAVGVWTFLEWLSIPEIVAVGVAAGIGYLGTHFVSDLIQRKADKL